MKPNIHLTLAILMVLVWPHAVAGQETGAQNFEALRATRPYTLVPVSDSTTSLELRLPALAESPKPWTDRKPKNDPRNFQFAVVTDRTGGMRPGIFEDAVRKLNLLQPEFVVSIGDLIEGYVEDEATIDSMWDELVAIVDELEMPFFYLPGNHDKSNDAMRRNWAKRFGPSYYHFMYDDVLFLCLDTEDAASTRMSEHQLEYFRQVLAENTDVRWTFVFMHKPLWRHRRSGEQLLPDNDKDRPTIEKSRWLELEELLKNRQHTVFAGHVHQYTWYRRNNQDYYALATTGGGSSLQGAESYGRFDHITWVTMGDEKPIMLNLELSGMYDMDLRDETETVLAIAAQYDTVLPEITFVDSLPFDNARLKVKILNPSDLPATIRIEMPENVLGFEPPTAVVELAPGENGNIEFKVSGNDMRDRAALNGLQLQWEGTWKQANRPDIVLREQVPLEFEIPTAVAAADVPLTVDGDLSDWTNMPGERWGYRYLDGHRHSWSGLEDSSFEIAAQASDTTVYFALKVHDDRLISGSGNRIDGVTLQILPETSVEATKESLIQITGTAVDPGKIKTESNREGITTAGALTPGGYTIEAAVPAEALSVSPDPWTTFRVNVIVKDEDANDGKPLAENYWKHPFGSKQDNKKTGVFHRNK